MPNFDPASYLALQFQAARMVWDAQTVIALRMMGFAGLRAQPRSEAMRMIAEKQIAFSAAMTDAAQATLRGKGPAAISEAALKPIARRARANSKRLRKK